MLELINCRSKVASDLESDAHTFWQLFEAKQALFLSVWTTNIWYWYTMGMIFHQESFEELGWTGWSVQVAHPLLPAFYCASQHLKLRLLPFPCFMATRLSNRSTITIRVQFFISQYTEEILSIFLPIVIWLIYVIR